MTQTLAQIWRHPVKAVGAEQLNSVQLTQDRPLPLDRAWAILAGDTEDTGTWQKCRNFARGCYGASLMAITATCADKDQITFRHPDLADLSLNMHTEAQKLVDWIAPIYPAERPAPHSVIAAPAATGMPDNDAANVSILNLSSLAELGQRLGTPLDPRRFRGNLWVDGFDAFAERDWIGKTIQIGAVKMQVTEHIGRCRATEVDPETGTRNANTLGALRDGWGHTEFGVYAKILNSGTIATRDLVTVL